MASSSLKNVVLISTLVLLSVVSARGQKIVYPQAAVGPLPNGTYEIELRLGNRNAGAEWRGKLRLLRNQDLAPMSNLTVTDAQNASVPVTAGEIAVAIPPNGSRFFRISSSTLQVGVMTIEPTTSSRDDVIASFYYRFLNVRGQVADLIPIQGVNEPATGYRVAISNSSTFAVGVAVVADASLQAAPGPAAREPIAVTFTAILEDGRELAGSFQLGGSEPRQKALFPGNVIPGLPASLRVAQLKIRSSEKLYVSTLAIGSPGEFEDVQIGGAPAQAEVDFPASGFSVNAQNREEVVQFFKTIYQASENIEPRWTGSVNGCVAGTVSAEFNLAIQRRINFFRAMSGVPADVVFSQELDSKAAQAALMMFASNRVSHTPDSSFTCFTAEGAEAALKSNLTLLTALTVRNIVDGYIRDAGATNTAAGHRRYLLFPRQSAMGAGSAGNESRGANALWVVGTARATPLIRSYWPPAGFVPYQLVHPRWSFSFPNADFRQASVTMTQDGTSIPLTIEPVQTGFGDNTIVWVPTGIVAGSPPADTTYRVIIGNALVGGSPQQFTYDVTLIDTDR